MKSISSLLSLLIAPVLFVVMAGNTFAQDKMFVYIGAYTQGTSEGIYVSELDRQTGKLSEPELAVKVENPNFLAIHPNGKLFYSIGAMKDESGKKIGTVNSYTIDRNTGKLTLLNQQSVVGQGPCHLVVDPDGKNVLAVNYGSGSTVCCPIAEDGSLEEASSFIQHEGSSVNPNRQKGPHAHSVNVDKNNRFAYVADLGLDKVLIYKLDAETGKLTPNDPPSVSVPPGGGPRHFAFHPGNQFAYTNNEMTCTVTAFDFDPENGSLKPIQTITTLPEKLQDSFSTAEIRVHPNGKFLYVSNRGHDTIAIFSIDQKTGKLTSIGHESTRGNIPRNFNLDPHGEFLLAANQKSGNVVVFKINPETGLLKATGQEIKVDGACCIRFLEVDETIAFNSLPPIMGCSLFPEGSDLSLNERFKSYPKPQKAEKEKQDE